MSKLSLEYLKHIFEETTFIVAKVNKVSENDFYHDYLGLNHSIVWDVVKNEMPL